MSKADRILEKIEELQGQIEDLQDQVDDLDLDKQEIHIHPAPVPYPWGYPYYPPYRPYTPWHWWHQQQPYYGSITVQSTGGYQLSSGTVKSGDTADNGNAYPFSKV